MTIRWILLPFTALLVAACGPGLRGPVHAAVESATLTQPLARIVFTHLSSGNLTVRRSDATTVHLTRKLQWRGDKPPQYTETWEGQTLRISYNCPLVNCSIDYQVELPENVELQAETSSGDVDVSGMAATVGIETSSGGVKLTAVKGDITVATSSGDVTGTDLAAAQASVTTSSGEVNLGFSTAPQAVTTHTSSGDTTILVPPRDPYRVQVRTSSGEQKVTVDRSESASRRIDTECSSGDVTIKYGQS
jgi:hypothetical protein